MINMEIRFQKVRKFFSKKTIKNYPLGTNYTIFWCSRWSISPWNRRKWPFQTSKIQNFPGEHDPGLPRMCGSQTRTCRNSLATATDNKEDSSEGGEVMFGERYGSSIFLFRQLCNLIIYDLASLPKLTNRYNVDID
jgi:hypothetical protein